MTGIYFVLADVSWWERLQAAARGDGGAEGWLWWSLPVLLAGVFTLTVLAWRFVRRREYERRQAAAFFSRGASVGLEKVECTLLYMMAQEASLPEATAIFSDDRAFADGAAALRRSRRIEHTTAAERGHIEGAVEHLRKKLGFQRADTAGTSVASTSAVRAATPAAPTVSPAPAGAAVPGGLFANTGDRSVGVNRRRYPRVATRRPCRIAPFAFETDAAMGTPEFVQATLVEIGGPGLKVSAPFAPSAGDRVMVMTQLNDGQAVQGLARVRRVGTAALAGAREIALEMIGLHPTEVAVLAEATT